ncbi:MAG: DUF871 family protein [Solobacterium sp.]|nr:DUF871 family protein [Solobacterium sp.]
MIKGVSVYPDLSSLEEIRAYLEKASAYGFTRVFSSMFSVPGSKEEILAYFTEFIQTAHQYGMEVSLDVNPQFLKKLGVTYDNLSLFHEIGCDVIRLDHNYGKEKDLAAINNPYGIRIQLNASMGIEEELAWLKEKGVTGERLWLGHNFYPQRYTALKWKKFLETNERLSAYGFPIEAFVSSNAENTHGVWGAQEGLPTVEMMRDYPIDLQARLLDASDHVDGILIGNAYADEEELQALQEALAPARDAKSSPLVQFMAQMGFPLPEIRREKRIRLALDEGLTENEKFFLFDSIRRLISATVRSGSGGRGQDVS